MQKPQQDPRFLEGLALFNAADWYPCHDLFEALWHETAGPDRAALQALLQIAVAHWHLERGNLRGATILMGEGLGRLAAYGDGALGLDLRPLRRVLSERLEALQLGEAGAAGALPPLEVQA
ncbi:DUF309 domain-containing protein [Cyanobium sp. Morenito 9A2]|uniref:DUF309 domain-containing protein n=1 Tax=Cyanobium sp. Morenito 9A2 TaxID=2823718 RepID=UPI0020CB6E0C|nr:DUF309 domain-containing protein [Cyanobium sp. Morenito 9A2]MCP9850540.1 DUF309 domain-containing protein [Cyanobium sp. Morenito 9A2]